MAKPPKPLVPCFKVEGVLRLTKIVFDNHLCLTIVWAYNQESSSSKSGQGHGDSRDGEGPNQR